MTSQGFGKIGARYYAQAPEAMTNGRGPRPQILPCPLCGLLRGSLKIHTGSRLCLKARAKQLQAKEKAA